MKATPKITPPPQAPTVASYISRAQSRQGMGQRPNKMLRPMTGASAVLSQRPNYLGGWK